MAIACGFSFILFFNKVITDICESSPDDHDDSGANNKVFWSELRGRVAQISVAHVASFVGSVQFFAMLFVAASPHNARFAIFYWNSEKKFRLGLAVFFVEFCLLYQWLFTCCDFEAT